MRLPAASAIAQRAGAIDRNETTYRANSLSLQFFIDAFMPSPPSKAETFLGLPKLPAGHASIVMPLLLSILMTFIVLMVSALRSIGYPPDFLQIWLGSWGISWVVAFPTLLRVLPVVKKATLATVRAA